ncbi:hypothetical protein [Achromobacter denitrificans]|nr:hypothetical protein [Achromobacter denitrificans]CAB3880146.1 hypothetical protein LMG1860_04289 [Achromobacter denitrificans]
MASHAGAAVLGLDGYGLRVGNEATFVALPAPNGAAAVAAAPAPRFLFRKGEPQGEASAFTAGGATRPA